MKHLSQGRRLISALRSKQMGYTYLEMQALAISTSPQKRVVESLRPDERLVKGKRGNLITWRVIKV